MSLSVWNSWGQGDRIFVCLPGWRLTAVEAREQEGAGGRLRVGRLKSPRLTGFLLLLLTAHLVQVIRLLWASVSMSVG